MSTLPYRATPSTSFISLCALCLCGKKLFYLPQRHREHGVKSLGRDFRLTYLEISGSYERLIPNS
jgi:hypothetical protein